MMWASVTGIIDRPGVGLMCLFMFLAAHAQTFFNTANVVTAVHNFQDYSGTIVGIMKVNVFLTSSIIVNLLLLLLLHFTSAWLILLLVFMFA